MGFIEPTNILKGDMRADRMQIGKTMLDWKSVRAWIPHGSIFMFTYFNTNIL